MVEILTWVFAAAFGGTIVTLVYLILQYIVPMLGSPAIDFVKAKREKKALFFLDDGPIYRPVVGYDKNTAVGGGEILRAGPEGHDIIKKGPGGLKYCKGVLIGVGENFRSFVANVCIMDLMEVINEKGWDSQEVKKRIDALVKHLKKDMGLTDDFKELDEWRRAEKDKLATDFNKLRTEIIAQHTVVKEEVKDVPQKS